MSYVKYIADVQHYNEVLSKVASVKKSLCPRVHFKMMIFDLDEVYVGSANLTGAGIGMKSAKTRSSVEIRLFHKFL